MLTLEMPLANFPTVKKPLIKRLHSLGLEQARDLLFYFPFRYEDYRSIVAINRLLPNQPVTIRGRLELIANRRSWKHKRILTEAVVADATGRLKIIWFNQPYLAKTLKVGDRLSLAGRATLDRFGLQLINPIYEKEVAGAAGVHTGRLIPIYPATAGVSQKYLRYFLKLVQPLFSSAREWLPPIIQKSNDLLALPTALQAIHFPKEENNFARARRRFQFEELFLIQLRNELTRRQLAAASAPELVFHETEIKSLVAALPWRLTDSQRRSAWEILQDTARPQPMNRLLSGDVGSGKTVVAAIALYNAALSGYQAALMAPTEILAQQHWQSLNKLLGDKMTLGLLTSNQQQIGRDGINPSQPRARQRREFLDRLKKGDVQIVVGTHALLSEPVVFTKLGLVIVDEQHRFGVEQRKLIKDKGRGAHFLSMTATPIPRSLALTIYGDLDLSVINELPPNRKTVITRLVESINRPKAYQFIRRQVMAGRQVFVICPLIDDPAEAEAGISRLVSEKKTVMAEHQKLQTQIFPDLAVGYLHGKMKATEKNAIMRQFKAGEIKILVATSVVEVGVDIPNANVMMIEGAEHFGLAQLHQFRGRVGRAEHQSYCLVFTTEAAGQPPARLKFFEKENDGFKLAEQDLALRGPGEIYGTEQSGLNELRLAELNDVELIREARAAAQTIAPAIQRYPLVKNRLKDWQKEFHLE